jgi:hypothetical protein
VLVGTSAVDIQHFELDSTGVTVQEQGWALEAMLKLMHIDRPAFNPPSLVFHMLRRRQGNKVKNKVCPKHRCAAWEYVLGRSRIVMQGA